MDNRELTPPYARHIVRLIRPFPNFDFFFIKSLRQKATQLLQLKPGDRAFDAGCGPGGSFPYLVDAVGPSGEVIGVEISPETAINARKRVSTNGWNNVHVLVSDAEKVAPEGQFDGLLMFAAPDVYASPRALANLFPYLKNDARVVNLWRQTLAPPPGKNIQSVVSLHVFPAHVPLNTRTERRTLGTAQKPC